MSQAERRSDGVSEQVALNAGNRVNAEFQTCALDAMGTIRPGGGVGDLAAGEKPHGQQSPPLGYSRSRSKDCEMMLAWELVRDFLSAT